MPESTLAAEIRARRQAAQFATSFEPFTVKNATIAGPHGEVELYIFDDFADRSNGAARLLLRFACSGLRYSGIISVSTLRPDAGQVQAIAEACATLAARTAGGSAAALVETRGC